VKALELVQVLEEEVLRLRYHIVVLLKRCHKQEMRNGELLVEREREE